MLTSAVLHHNFSIFTSCCTFSDIYWIRHVITWILLLALEHSLKYEGHSLISVEHGLTSVQSGLLPLEHSGSQWPRGLRRRSSAARLLSLWVRFPPGAWIFVCCECCVLSGRGFCDRLITRPEESYRLWRVVVCDQETSKTRRLKSATGLWKIQPQWAVEIRKPKQPLEHKERG